MALIQSSGSAGTSGGGGGGSYDWAYESFDVTVTTNPPATYAALNLNFTPASVYAAVVWSEGQLLHPSEYVIEDFGTGPILRLLFPIDPAMSANGTAWQVSIQYAYIP